MKTTKELNEFRLSSNRLLKEAKDPLERDVVYWYLSNLLVQIDYCSFRKFKDVEKCLEKLLNGNEDNLDVYLWSRKTKAKWHQMIEKIDKTSIHDLLVKIDRMIL